METMQWHVGYGYGRYRDGMLMVQLTLLRTRLLPNLNALVAVSKGMSAVKPFSNKILFLTGGAG